MSDKRKGSWSGTWVVAAMLLAALVFMAGLYWAAYRTKPPAYRRAVKGLPGREVRLVSWDLEGGGDRERIVQAIKQSEAEIVLLQRVEPLEAQEIARALDMRSRGELELYLPSPGEARCAIMAHCAIYQGREMPKPRGLGYGIFVEPVMDGHKFLVGSVEIPKDGQDESKAMIREWKKEGEMPAIAGGDFGGIATDEWKIAIAAGSDRVMVSPGVKIEARQQAVSGFVHPMIRMTISGRGASFRP